MRRKSNSHPELVLAILAVALVVDAMTSAIAQSALDRLWNNLLARPSDTGAFRFYLQPTMAAILALRDGIKDARAGRSPYLWALLQSNPAERTALLREGVTQTRRIILLGIIMDTVYQLAVLKALYPLELILVVLLLCYVPYLLLRGPVTRIARWWLTRQSDRSASAESHRHR
jgi:hypothetical protein